MYQFLIWIGRTNTSVCCRSNKLCHIHQSDLGHYLIVCSPAPFIPHQLFVLLSHPGHIVVCGQMTQTFAPPLRRRAATWEEAVQTVKYMYSSSSGLRASVSTAVKLLPQADNQQPAGRDEGAQHFYGRFGLLKDLGQVSCPENYLSGIQQASLNEIPPAVTDKSWTSLFSNIRATSL